MGQCDAAGNGSRPNLCSFEKPVIEVVSRSSSFYREPFRCLLGQIREVITGLRFDDVCLRDGLVERVGCAKPLLLDDAAEFGVEWVESILAEPGEDMVDGAISSDAVCGIESEPQYGGGYQSD